MNGVPDDLQVVTNSAVIWADESTDSGDVIGVRNELIIGNTDMMNLEYPKQTMSLSACVNTMIPTVETKTFVKTTIRRANVMMVDQEEEKEVSGWPIDLHSIISSMVNSFKDRIKSNEAIHVVVEIWFDPMSEADFFNMCKEGPYASYLSGK